MQEQGLAGAVLAVPGSTVEQGIWIPRPTEWVVSLDQDGVVVAATAKEAVEKWRDQFRATLEEDAPLMVTEHIHVTFYRRGFRPDGTEVRVDEDYRVEAFHPQPPRCRSRRKHSWRLISEVPWTNGFRGSTTKEHCRHCGVVRVTSVWFAKEDLRRSVRYERAARAAVCRSG